MFQAHGNLAETATTIISLNLFKDLDIRQKRDGRVERRLQQKKGNLNELDQLSKELEVGCI